ncbi:hypothetical protein ACTGYP_05500 [Streptococcus suis]
MDKNSYNKESLKEFSKNVSYRGRVGGYLMDLYESVSKKLGKDLLQYLDDLRKADAQKTD